MIGLFGSYESLRSRRSYAKKLDAKARQAAMICAASIRSILTTDRCGRESVAESEAFGEVRRKAFEVLDPASLNSVADYMVTRARFVGCIIAARHPWP
jgi:hypothetical protein